MKKKLVSYILVVCMLLSMLPTMAWAEDVATSSDVEPLAETPVNLDITNGSIVIDGDGYTQGENEKVPYIGEYIITQTDAATATANAITVTGGDPIITLSGVNINGNIITIEQSATLVLEGENKVVKTGGTNPPVYIKNGATLTIKVPDGKADDYGSLIADGSGSIYLSGIGGSTTVHGGSLVIASGTVTAKGGKDTGGISPVNSMAGMNNITINGGNVTVSGGYSLGHTQANKVASAVNINGGNVTINKDIHRERTTVKGGNIIFSGLLSSTDRIGRKLTTLIFIDNSGNAIADTAVTVKEGTTNEWTALTSAEGKITTYLGPNTTEVTVTSAAWDGEKVIAIANGRGLLGPACACGDGSSTLTLAPVAPVIITEDKNITLNATFTNNNCVVPEGFHGGYETITYEVTKVMRGEAEVANQQLASITGNTLTVKNDTENGAYMVYVKASCGPDGTKVTSGEIAVMVSPYQTVAENAPLDITNGSIVIDADGYTQGTNGKVSHTGEYIITQSNAATATANTITVNGIATGKTITLDGVNISAALPIEVKSGVSATFVLSGDNTLNATADQSAGIFSNGGNVTINGTDADSLNITHNGGFRTAGIGVNKGSIVINGGRFNISSSGGYNIGNYNPASGIGKTEITINGGIFGLSTTRVYKSCFWANNGTFTLNGGTLRSLSHNQGSYISANAVVINGGNVNSYYTGDITGRKLTKLHIVDTNGTPVTTEVTLKEGSNEWSALPNAEGVITTYLADGTTGLVYNGKTYPVIPGMGNTIGVYCTCGDGCSITWTGVPAEITLYSGDTSKTVAVSAAFVKASNCLAPVHPVDIVLSLTGDTNDCTLTDDGKLTISRGTGNYELTLKAVAGTLATDTKAIKVNCVTDKGLDIANGSVEVVAGTEAGKVTYKQNGIAKYENVPVSEPVTITGTLNTSPIIEITNCSPTIILENVTTTQKGSSNIRVIGSASDAKLILSGTNTITRPNENGGSVNECGIEIKGAKLTIDCKTHLGGECAGISCEDKLIVKVQKYEYGAAIGATKTQTEGFEVNFDGGYIDVSVSGVGAAIGAGDASQNIAAVINIDDGYVKATAPAHTVAIGARREIESGDISVNIDGGEVEAVSIGDNTKPAINATNVAIEDADVTVKGDVEAKEEVSVTDAKLDLVKRENDTDGGGITGNLAVSGTSVVTAVGGVSGTVTVGAGSSVDVGGTISGTVTVEGGATINGVTLPEDSGTVTIPADKVDEVTADENGTVTLPAGSTVTKDGETVALPNGGTIAPDGTITADVALDITNGSIVIDADGYTQGEDAKIAHEGDYVITQTDAATATANTITVNGIATGKTITLDGVNIVAPAKRPAILIAGDATIRMAAGSQNTLTGGQYHPAIEPLNGTTVTVGGAGDGALNAIGGDGETSAIGGAHGRSNLGLNLNNNSRNFGSVVINGGTITAKGGYVTAHGSAIGGTTLGYVRYVTINGGTIYADYDRAIYSSQDDRKGGNIIINGGKIVARNVDNVISTINNGTITIDSDVVITGGAASYNKGGTQYDRTQIKIWGAGAEQKSVTVTVTVDSGTPFQTETDENGWISYLYLTDSAQHTINITGADNKTYTTGAFTATAGNVVFAKNTAITDYSEKCTMENSGIVFDADVPSTVSIYDGIASVNISCPATQSVFEGCYAVEHILSYSYAVEKDGVAVAESEKAQYAELTGSTLTLKRNGTYDVIVTATCNSVSASKTITVTGSGTKALNIGLGPVAIVAGESDGTFTYKQNGTPVFENLQADDIVVITGEYYYKTANINALYIKDCSPTIIFEDVTISDNGNPQNVYLSTILIEGTDDIEDHVTFLISGENYVLRTKNQASAREYCGIEIRNAELTIDCIEGSANCSGENCPHKLVVKSTLADQRGAVIGSRSGESSAGFTLNIDGGMIEVSSSGGSGTAIGTGINAPSSSEVNIIITDGYVEAVVANGDGTAIGAGKNSTQTTVNVAIEGGEVVAKAKRGNICRNNTTLSGGATINDALIPAAVDSVTIPADKLDEVTADENGTVTLPAGSTVTKDGKIIALPKGGTIAADGTITIYVKVTVKDAEGNETTITPPADGENVTVNPDGTMELPEGTVVEKPDGSTTTLPDGGSMDAEGNTTTEGTTITENTDGSVTVTDKDGNETTITPAEGENVTVNPDGTMELPEGTVVEKPDGSTTTLPAGGSMGAEGNTTTEGTTITKNTDGSVTVTDKDGNETTVTPPADGENVTVNTDGTMTMPEGTVIESADGSTTTLPDGGSVSAEGNFATDGTTITKDKDGSVTVDDGESVTTITPDEGKDITVKPDGTMELPEGTMVEKADGTITTLPDGGSVNTEGTVATEGTTITEKADGTVEITKGEETTTITPPAEGGSITVKPDGTVEVPAGSEIETESGTATIPEDSGTVTIPADKVDEVAADENGTVTLPAGTTVTKDGETVTLTKGGTIAADGTVTDPAAPPETPETPENPENPEVPETPEKPEKPTPKPPHYVGGYYPIVTPDETPADEPTDKPADNPADKPVDKPATTTPVTPPAEEVVTPSPEDKPVVDEPVVDDPVVDEPAMEEPADDAEPSGGNIGLWIGIGIVALAAIVVVLAIMAARKKRK